MEELMNKRKRERERERERACFPKALLCEELNIAAHLGQASNAYSTHTHTQTVAHNRAKAKNKRFQRVVRLIGT